MWEERELVIVVSTRRHVKARTEHECVFCKRTIYPGDYCYSFGVVDRKHDSRERRYTCEEHSYIFDYSSVEDCPEEHQRFLLENRLTNEVWYIERGER